LLGDEKTIQQVQAYLSSSKIDATAVRKTLQAILNVAMKFRMNLLQKLVKLGTEPD
jgi:hypothetical protein